MPRLLLLSLTLLALLPIGAGAEARVATEPYVASTTNNCAIYLFDDFLLGEDLGGEETLRPYDGAPCFAILPGETRVRIDVEDALGAHVPFWYAFYAQDGGHRGSGVACGFSEGVPVPEDATRLSVVVYPRSLTCGPLGPAGTTGTVTAAFT